jgi:membrane protein YqaA with SNARE-associated domain
MTLLLALVSYIGGVLSYFVGKRIHYFPIVQKWINNRFQEQSLQLKKFGGLLIFLSAIAPLPFAPVCTIAGIVNFRLRLFLILATTRFLRFFLYAFFIFGLT